MLSLAKADPAPLWLGRPGPRETFLGCLVESPVGRPSSQQQLLPGSRHVSEPDGVRSGFSGGWVSPGSEEARDRQSPRER